MSKISTSFQNVSDKFDKYSSQFDDLSDQFNSKLLNTNKYLKDTQSTIQDQWSNILSNKLLNFLFYVLLLFTIVFLFIYGITSITGTIGNTQNPELGIRLIANSGLILFLIYLPLISYY